MEDAEHQQQFLKVGLYCWNVLMKTLVYTLKLRMGQLGLIYIVFLANKLFWFFLT